MRYLKHIYSKLYRNLDDIFSEILNEPIKKVEIRTVDAGVERKSENSNNSTVLARVVLAFKT